MEVTEGDMEVAIHEEVAVEAGREEEGAVEGVGMGEEAAAVAATGTIEEGGGGMEGGVIGTEGEEGEEGVEGDTVDTMITGGAEETGGIGRIETAMRHRQEEGVAGSQLLIRITQ